LPQDSEEYYNVTATLEALTLKVNLMPTVENTYGKPFKDLTPPEGYRFGEFKVPEPNDIYLGTRDDGGYAFGPTTFTQYATKFPRLILIPLLKKYIVFDVLAEDDCPDRGEYFCARDMETRIASYHHSTPSRYVLGNPRIETCFKKI
jgi:hypothetical protein